MQHIFRDPVNMKVRNATEFQKGTEIYWKSRNNCGNVKCAHYLLSILKFRQ